ncbi:heterokaryon incompatibility protein-domain-containing protein [Alternaria rosae]|uniref:heterokaryon incompatibility protein-domain-containing protein n=1 Tax=Alternaria rosae TaxID=1187941 RepID=UPI001E8E59B1|nr:heterokaryon incompatibility protein-domain-containing protein [Alternaria rosae]KAH6864737.1 heterokaryon incompatibility protein-domain-containing protein [Alternaria rosae]
MSGGGWVRPPGGDQAQPTCFGIGQLRIPERSESQRLCSACMSLGCLNSTHWESINNFRKVIVDHHHSFDAILKSAREGCHLCGLLLIAWEEKCSLEQEPGGGWVGKLGLDSVSLSEGIRLEFKRWAPTLRSNLDEVRINILCGDLPSTMGGRLICKALDSSSASLSRIKAWLNICSSSHSACSRAGSRAPPLPTRVIAVGTKGSSKCHLVSGNKKHGYYATLSHCWGDPRNRPLSTTDRTLPHRQRGIEFEALPKTFRDAVQVCREIGIEYIWIDSLCIIQEQETQEDWAKEAPTMGQVYGNSILTISAAAAADSTQGCFKERLGLILWPCPIVLFGQSCYLFRYPMNREEIWGNPGDGEWDVSNVLARRAWVLQEQVLSLRTITFSKDLLIWRCPTLSTNEKYPLGIPHAPDISVDSHRLLQCIVNGITSFMPIEPTFGNYDCWYKIVEEFTSRNLTYEEDRLPAIAGIAKRFGMAVNDSYHAGLWRHDMILGLLWRKRGIAVTCTAKSGGVPSWSWASIKGRVTYSDLLSANHDASRIPLSSLVDILDVSDPITHEDHPFGVTSRASLSLSGVLLAVMQDKHEDFGLVLGQNGTRFSDNIGDFYPDIWDSDRQNQAPLVCLPVGVCHSPHYAGAQENDEVCKASWKRSLEMGTDKLKLIHTLYCLILQAVEGKQVVYSRVGLCRVANHKTIEISRMASFGERRAVTII